MRYLRKMIEKYIDVEDDEWSYVCSKLKLKTVKKGAIVHRAGDIFSEIWFIKSGLARSYFTDINGKNFTWQIYFRGRSKQA